MSSSKLSQFWSKQPVTIRAVIITAVIGLIGIFIDRVPPRDEKSKTKPLQYNISLNSAAEFNETPILFTTINDRVYGVVPTKCMLVTYGGHKKEFEPESILQDVSRKGYTFNLVTEQPVIINNAVIKILKYSPPPSENKIYQIRWFEIPGMGGVPVFKFPEQVITSTTDIVILIPEDGSIILDSGDAVAFVFPFIFQDPGVYKFKIIIQGQLDFSREVQFSSDTLINSWLFVDNIENYAISSNLYSEDVVWVGACP